MDHRTEALAALGFFALVACTSPSESRANLVVPTQVVPAPVKLQPHTSPAPEILDARVLETAKLITFGFNNYPRPLIDALSGFWQNGTNGLVPYKFRSSDQQTRELLFIFNPAQVIDSRMGDDSGQKGVITTNSEIKEIGFGNGSRRFGLIFSGKYRADVAARLPTAIERILYDQEAVSAIASLNILASVDASVGLDLGGSSEGIFTTDPRFKMLKRYVDELNPYVVAVTGLFAYVETSPSRIGWLKAGDNYFPRLQGGAIFLDAGAGYAVESTIGSSLKGVSSLEDLQKRYPNLSDIPGYEKYLRAVETTFRTN